MKIDKSLLQKSLKEFYIQFCIIFTTVIVLKQFFTKNVEWEIEINDTIMFCLIMITIYAFFPDKKKSILE